MPDRQLTFQELLDGCGGSLSAIRLRVQLQPIAGPGEKVFPATHLKGVYAEEFRNISDHNGGFRKSKAVLIDSVQSQANRLEHVLLQAVDVKEIELPMLYLEVGGHRVTSFDAPHRIYDAFFWDALLSGQAFRESEIGRAIVAAQPRRAQSLFEYAPTALLFGAWDSRSGGLRGARFARAIESQIVALDAEVGVLTSSRICPVGIRKVAAYKGQTTPYTLRENEAAKDKDGKALTVEVTAVGHSNIPPRVEPGGITATEIVQTAVISLTQLRQLRFGDEAASNVARATLAAIGLVALTSQLHSGYALRSRCHLIPIEQPLFELIGNRASEIREVEIDAKQARQLLVSCVEAVRGHAELAWHVDPIPLQPSPRLAELVRMSEQATAVEEEGE